MRFFKHLFLMMKLICLSNYALSVDFSNVYKWEDFIITSVTNSSSIIKVRPASNSNGHEKIYVSLTTINSRIHDAADTIRSIIFGTIQPTHIYLFVSKYGFLLDEGITPELIISSGIAELQASHAFFSVVFTDNIGPHRKLLPLLAKKWNEDCVIITIDDHVKYPVDTLQSLLDYYRASGMQSVVALRARRIGLCDQDSPWRTAPYPKKGFWPIASIGRQEILLLPTGAGGVLYRPSFFAAYVFDPVLRNLTVSGDDLMFRLGTLGKGVPVVTACNDKISSMDGGRITCPKQMLLRKSQGNHRQLRSSNRTTLSSTSTSTSVTNDDPRRLQNGSVTNDGRGLWSSINRASRANDVMWRRSLQYLSHIGAYDFNRDLQKYAPLERNQCRLHPASGGERGSRSSVLSELVGRVKATVQSIYDHECGIQYCDSGGDI